MKDDSKRGAEEFVLKFVRSVISGRSVYTTVAIKAERGSR